MKSVEEKLKEETYFGELWTENESSIIKLKKKNIGMA